VNEGKESVSSYQFKVFGVVREAESGFFEGVGGEIVDCYIIV
jgi:hypothetical protein